MKKLTDPRTRFFAKVEKTDGCWMWTGTKNHKSGYGLFWLNGKFESPHRVSWTFANGEIPEGKHVLHSCDVRLCVNPAHLRVGTPTDNSADRVARGRSLAGELNPLSKISNEQTHELRRLRDGGCTLECLANRYGVTISSVSKIAKRINRRTI